jgi:type IV fimbrial biogenesis protein FimT
MRRLNPQRGLTLIEAVVGLGIAAFLAITAAPYFADYAANSRLREGGHVLYAESLAAQAEAVKRNGTVRLSVDGGTVQVLDMAVPATPVVLRERLLSSSVTATTTTIDFNAEGRPLPFPSTASVNLSYSGVSCSADYRCPGLRVEAGGSIRLCANHLDSTC